MIIFYRKKQEDFEKELQNSHEQWNQIYKFGCSDPFWPDGVNLNLVRNHIISYRKQIEESFAPEDYPAVYFKEIPFEIDQDYMARADEIREAAKHNLEIYKAHPDYLYIIKHKDDFTVRTQRRLCIPAVIGYVSGLKKAIETDDLVTMRRHESPESYLDSFTSCVEKMNNQPAEDVQMSFFSMNESHTDEEFDLSF